MPASKKTSTETNLKRQVMSMLSAEYPDAVVRKRHGSIYSTVGDPDLYILYRGVHIETELKRPGQRPTPIQVRRLLEWQRAGAVIAVIRTVDEMRELMYGLGIGHSAAGTVPLSLNPARILNPFARQALRPKIGKGPRPA